MKRFSSSPLITWVRFILCWIVAALCATRGLTLLLGPNGRFLSGDPLRVYLVAATALSSYGVGLGLACPPRAAWKFLLLGGAVVTVGMCSQGYSWRLAPAFLALSVLAPAPAGTAAEAVALRWKLSDEARVFASLAASALSFVAFALALR